MSEKIRLVADMCTPTAERRPTTIDDIYDDFKVLEFDSKEELADELAQMNGYDDLEEFKQELADDDRDLDDYDFEGDELDKICQYLLSGLNDPGDGSPNIQYISINDKPAYEDYWMTYDTLLDNMDLLAHGSEEDIIKYYIIKYYLECGYDYVEEDDDDDDEDDEDGDDEDDEDDEDEEDDDKQVEHLEHQFDETVKKLREEGYIVDVASHIDLVFETKCYAIACAYTRKYYKEKINNEIDSNYVGRNDSHSADFIEQDGCFGIFDSDSGDDYEICTGVELMPTDANTVDELVREIEDNVGPIEESFKSKDKYSVLREALDRLDREDNKDKEKRIRTRAQIRNLRSRLKQ